MKQPTTVYLYELAWILPSIAIPVGMLVALTVTALPDGCGIGGTILFVSALLYSSIWCSP